MDREDILKRSQEENQYQDLYQQEVYQQASKYSRRGVLLLAAGLFLILTSVTGFQEWGHPVAALICADFMTVHWVHYTKLHKKADLLWAVFLTLLVVLEIYLYIHALGNERYYTHYYFFNGPRHG